MLLMTLRLIVADGEGPSVIHAKLMWPANLQSLKSAAESQVLEWAKTKCKNISAGAFATIQRVTYREGGKEIEVTNEEAFKVMQTTYVYARVTATVDKLYLGRDATQTFFTKTLQEGGALTFDTQKAANARSADKRLHVLLVNTCTALGYPTEEKISLGEKGDQSVVVERPAEDLQGEVMWLVQFGDDATYQLRADHCPLKGKTRKLWASKPFDVRPVFVHCVSCSPAPAAAHLASRP
jgi:hypothetical protein